METVTVCKLKQDLEKGSDGLVCIDVRTPSEFEGAYVDGVKNIPLSDIENAVDDLKDYTKVYMMCHSGTRSQMACDTLKAKGLDNLVTVDGGIQAWIKKEYPVKGSGKKSLPIMRQVMIIAGSLILTGVLGALFVRPEFIYLSGFVGAGLLFAGVSGICFMTKVLAVMPWNK